MELAFEPSTGVMRPCRETNCRESNFNYDGTLLYRHGIVRRSSERSQAIASSIYGLFHGAPLFADIFRRPCRGIYDKRCRCARPISPRFKWADVDRGSLANISAVSARS